MNQVEARRQRIQIFSGMITAVTALLLVRLTGSQGVAYLAVAAECLFFMTTVIGDKTADALGRLLRGRGVRERQRNAAQIKRRVMLLQCGLGLVGSVTLAALSKPLAEGVFHVRYSFLVILFLAPAVFFRSVCTVFLGYFQGEGFELPTAASALLRPVLLLGLSVFLCRIFTGHGLKVSALLGKTEFTSMYGAAGAALAVSLAEGLAMLFLLLIYKGSRRRGRDGEKEGGRAGESLLNLAGLLYKNMALPVLIRLFAGLPLLFGMVFFFGSAQDSDAAAESYGLFFGGYLAALALLCFLLCGLVLQLCAKTVACLKKEGYRQAGNHFQKGIHFIWANTLFFGVALTVLAEPFSEILYGAPTSALKQMLQVGSFLLMFVTFSFYFGKILLLWGKKYLVLGILGAVNILFVIFTVLFLNTMKTGVLPLVYAGLISALFAAALLGFFVFSQIRGRVDVVRTLFIPMGAAGAAGLLCIFAEKLLASHIGNPAAFFAGFVPALLMFWGILLGVGNFRPAELLELYKFRKKS